MKDQSKQIPVFPLQEMPKISNIFKNMVSGSYADEFAENHYRILMLERQLLRFLAVKNVYGYKSAVISSFFPPLLPLRMVLGNIINFHATTKAWMMNITRKKNQKQSKKTRHKWSKTDHEFLEEEILKRYRRNLGDTLLYKGLISSDDLDQALSLSKESHKKLGMTLMEQGLVSEEDITISVCELMQKPYMKTYCKAYISKDADKYDLELLREIKAAPIDKTKEGLIVQTTLDSDEDRIRELLGQDVFFVYTTKANIYKSLEKVSEISPRCSGWPQVEKYIKEGLITIDQGLLAMRYSNESQKMEETLRSMGLLAEAKSYGQGSMPSA